MRLTNENVKLHPMLRDLSIFIGLTICICLPTTWAAETSTLSDKRLCADPKCERIISTGKTTIMYNSGGKGLISFKINSPVRIMSKSAGTNKQLWGVDIGGRRGYANKAFILEDKIIVSEKDLQHEVPVVGPGSPPSAATPAVAPPEAPLKATEVEPPVPNASESADDLATTTTSPLDIKGDAIVTKKDAVNDQQVPDVPTASSQVLQMVDGTRLPMEAIPAVTERTQDQQVVPSTEKSQTASAAVDTKEPQPVATTTESNDSQQQQQQQPEKVVAEQKEPTLAVTEALKLQQVENVPKDPQQQAATTETASAPKEPVTVAPVAINADIDDDTDDFDYEEDDAEEVDQYDELEVDSRDNETLNEVANDKKPINVNETTELKPNLVEQTIDKSAPSTVEEVPKTEQQRVEAPATELPIPSILQNIASIKEAPQEATTERQLEEIVAPKEVPVTTTPTSVEEIVAPKEIPATTTPTSVEEIVAPKEVPVTTTPTSVEEIVAPKQVPETTTPTSVEEVVAPKVVPETTTPTVEEVTERVETFKENVVPKVAENEIQSEPATAKVEDTIAAQPLVEVEASATTPSPIEDVPPVPTEPSVGLPPLFDKQNFANPNEYYKKLQEQQEAVQRPPREASFDNPNDYYKQQREQQEKLEKELKQKEQLQQEKLEKELKQQQEKLKEELKQKEQLQQEKLEAELKQQQEKVDEQLRQQEQDKVDEQLRQQQQEEVEKQLRQQEHQKVDEQLRQQQQEEVKEHQKVDEQLRQQQQKEVEEQRLKLQQTTPTPSYEAPYAAVDDEPTAAPHSEEASAENAGVGSVEPLALPSTASPVSESSTTAIKEDGLGGGGGGGGLFATIVDTVNTFISSQGSKSKDSVPLEERRSDELQRILYPGMGEKPTREVPPADVDGHCARFQAINDNDHCHRTISLDNFVEVLAGKLVDHSQLLLCVVIAAASSLFFIFGYYCFCNSSQEGALLSKLNHLERSLLTSHKENLIIKNDLMTTRTKLASIEDNSFGSNDMVAALKKQLETELYEKGKLQEQVISLESDVDKAAEAGLELNRMLSEVLGNQNGNDAIMSTADELQRQLNEQEKIIDDINSSLAEKSRENSELQYSYTEATARLTSELKALQEDNYELDMEKSKLQTRLEEIQAENEQELAKALETRNYEMQRLQNQILDLTTKWEKEHGDLQTSLAKIEALEDCLKAVKKDANLNVHELISSAKTRGELNAAQKKFADLQSKLEQEQVHKGRLESQLKQSNADVEQLKQDFNQSERDKLEAQTRLEVLSGYFREKENELKTELSLQETKWLQHQGENASTVETQTLMKNDIQTLKSQNDELRAEIEAQIASHKAQMGTLENRAHESWLAARQSERRCEEALAEAAGLRRKLTTMAAGGDPAQGDSISSNGGESKATAAPSPVPLPLPGSPLLNMPNPLPFLAAPFSPFMGLPPPFLPPAAAGGARPPPLGRMRSPPPAASGSRGHRDRDRERYSDYSDYDDYDDDEEDDRRRRHSGSWGRGRRDSYSRDSPRTYRSLSPSDSRYNYRHDTETDYSPPPSPRPVASGHRNGPGTGTGTGAGSRTYSEV